MQTSDFDFDLPEELIAQTPLKNRSSSRLLVVDKKTGKYEDRHFSNILGYMNPGDALVLNETKVLPARIIGFKPETGGIVELLLLKNLENDTWECLARPQKRLKKGTRIVFGVGAQTDHKNSSKATLDAKNNQEPYDTAPLIATVLDILDEGITHVQFSYQGIFIEILEKLGTMPLPPYIHKQLKDQSRYQTVYAKNLGSAAAPTAGLHFTPELLEKAKKQGVEIIKITLHVGLGTFRPVQTENLKSHIMHTESYEITEEAAAKLNAIREKHGKIFAVGTTTVRTLESNLKNHNKFTAETAETDIFIYPGYQFKAVDSLITNFHLPKSTLLMLVSAFCGTEKTGRNIILGAYRHAIEEKYRFFSFGDAMLITEQK